MMETKCRLGFIPTPLQETILKIARDVIKRRHIMDCDELYAYCTRILKHENAEKIRKEINLFIEKKVFIQGKALALETVLDNKNRSCILEVIKLYPGINQSMIQQMIDVNLGTIKWHIAMLEKFQLIKGWCTGSYIAYFTNEIDERYYPIYCILNKRLMANILEAISCVGYMTITDIEDLLVDIPRTTLARKLDELVDAKLLIAEKQDQKAAYKINAQYRTQIMLWFKRNHIKTSD